MTGYLIPILLVVVLGFIAAVMLTIAAKVMYVPVDERVTACREALPGANCGACGFAGCDDYAAACVEGEALNKCPVGGADAAAALGAIMGVEVSAGASEYACVNCSGSCDATKSIMDYAGIETCKAAKNFYGGTGACSYGCMAFGDCVKACGFNAIGIVNGTAWVDRNNCVACGACAKACPNGLIKMVPAKNLVYVACSSQDKGADTNKACKAGCIACQKCVKACKFEAITIVNNHAVVDPEKCKNCGMCAKECPKNVIVKLPKPKKVEA